jgi:hypothetical protein
VDDSSRGLTPGFELFLGVGQGVDTKDSTRAWLAESRDRMTCARQSRTMRAEVLLEDVADCVERRAVPARDDEHREHRRCQRVEWDHGLVRRSFGHRGARRFESRR